MTTTTAEVRSSMLAYSSVKIYKTVNLSSPYLRAQGVRERSFSSTFFALYLRNDSKHRDGPKCNFAEIACQLQLELNTNKWLKLCKLGFSIES